MTEVFRS